MSRLSFVLAIALVSAAPVGVASAHAEAPRSGEVQVTLSARGVDFADQAQVKAFYDRVRTAARAVCVSDSLTPGDLKEDRECRSRFISAAVDQVNAPLLTAMNNSDSRRPSKAFATDDR